jgi:hypothetical protein
LSFICGSKGDTAPDGRPSLRSEFLRYLVEHKIQGLRPVVAEKAIEEFSREPEEPFVNLSEFESLIAESVDSVLIFPESPGSFAELGLFSGTEQLAKKTLIANRDEHQRSSFLTLGPIHHIAAVSDFRPLPITVGNESLGSFATIVERLRGEEKIRKRRRRYEHGPLKELDQRTQLAVIAELVAVCGVLTEENFKFLLRTVFGAYDISRVRRQLALLVAMRLIRRSDASDIIAISDAESLIEFDSKRRTTIKGKWMNVYQEQCPELLQLRREVLHEP